MTRDGTLARTLAPDDVRPGMYIAPLLRLDERQPNVFDATPTVSADGVIRSVRIPTGSATPALVVDVCLPYLFVRSPRGTYRVLDGRRFKLARVSDAFGTRVFRQLAKDDTTEDASYEDQDEDDDD